MYRPEGPVGHSAGLSVTHPRPIPIPFSRIPSPVPIPQTPTDEQPEPGVPNLDRFKFLSRMAHRRVSQNLLGLMERKRSSAVLSQRSQGSTGVPPSHPKWEGGAPAVPLSNPGVRPGTSRWRAYALTGGGGGGGPPPGGGGGQ